MLSITLVSTENSVITHKIVPTHLETESFATAFDYPVLLKHHIDQSLLPKGSVLIDKPESFVEANIWIMWLLLRWNIMSVGIEYPAGKLGEQINLYARISTVGDVFDALMSVRCYKPTWPLEQVVALFKEQ